jgi:AraC family transcriptional regulator
MNQEDYIKRILKAMIYIEDHIDDKLDLARIAKIACYSPSHFHRIFQAMTGETIHGYIKRLRMQIAAEKLRYTEQPVTEIALDANFETPSAFTKAFKQFTGSSPRKYRSLYATFNRMTQKIKELVMIQPETIEKSLSNMDVLFIRRHGDYAQSPAAAWQAMTYFLDKTYPDRSVIRYFGISHDDPDIVENDKLRYDAAVMVPEGGKENGEVGRQTIKGGKYAIFIHQGSYDLLQETFSRVFLKWLPISGENFDESRSIFCEYLHLEDSNIHPENRKTKIFIPLC